MSGKSVSRLMLNYEPGPLPEFAAPNEGEKITLALDGLPPCKSARQSLRNPRSRSYPAFVALRKAASEAIAGRAWYCGPVRADVNIFAPSLPPGRDLGDYVGGIMDTLDGSHGLTFTYLPIVFEDDCQISGGSARFIRSKTVRYEVTFTFLPDGSREAFSYSGG